jgi:hypothetical protein
MTASPGCVLELLEIIGEQHQPFIKGRLLVGFLETGGADHRLMALGKNTESGSYHGRCIKRSSEGHRPSEMHQKNCGACHSGVRHF